MSGKGRVLEGEGDFAVPPHLFDFDVRARDWQHDQEGRGPRVGVPNSNDESGGDGEAEGGSEGADGDVGEGTVDEGDVRPCMHFFFL